jgi:hypothetical protein
MLVITPAQCGQGRQRNVGKDTSAASAGPSKTKLPWNNAGYGNEAMGNNKEHNKDTTYADVLQLRRDWAYTYLISSTALAPQRQQYLADERSRQ